MIEYFTYKKDYTYYIKEVGYYAKAIWHRRYKVEIFYLGGRLRADSYVTREQAEEWAKSYIDRHAAEKLAALEVKNKTIGNDWRDDSVLEWMTNK